MCILITLVFVIIIIERTYTINTSRNIMKDTKTRLLGLTLSATFILSSLAPAVASSSEEDVTHASYPVTS